MADQLTTVSKTRLLSRIGRLSARDMQQVERAVRMQLALSNTQRLLERRPKHTHTEP